MLRLTSLLCIQVACAHLIGDIDVNASSAVLLGTGRDAGADEDDFHTLKRQTSELDKADKKEIQQKKRVNVRVGAHSGTLKTFGKPTMSKAKKVVYF